jgi:hypothetical protein
VCPTGFLGRPKDVDGAVLVGIFRVGPLRTLRFEFRVLLRERVRNVLEEDQAEHDMLVFGGVHIRAERVGSLPQFPLETKICPITRCCHYATSPCDIRP